MWFLLNFLFSIGNILTLGFIYKDTIKQFVGLVIPYGSRVAIPLFLFILKLRIQQWWGNNIEHLEDGQHIVSLAIRGRLVKIILEDVKDPPVTIIDDEEVDITEDAIPYFRVKYVEVTPDFFYSDKMVLEYSDGKQKEL